MTIEFRPDRAMFGNTPFDPHEMVEWFKGLPLDHSAFTIEWIDKRGMHENL